MMSHKIKKNVLDKLEPEGLGLVLWMVKYIYNSLKLRFFNCINCLKR